MVEERRCLSKAEIVRNQRNAARILKGRVGVYSRVLVWKEEKVGTDDAKYTVILKKNWSFSKEFYEHSKSFKTHGEAMRAIHKTHKLPAVKCSDDWEDRLNRLKNAISEDQNASEDYFECVEV